MRRLYHETSAEETKEIDKALLLDSQLQRQYQEMAAMKKELDEAKLEPSDVTVKNILHYAQGLQEHSWSFHQFITSKGPVWRGFLLVFKRNITSLLFLCELRSYCLNNKGLISVICFVTTTTKNEKFT